ncbi:hypothetical protein VULLAG_LOCUS23762 [Vulpes lagopus]
MVFSSLKTQLASALLLPQRPACLCYLHPLGTITEQLVSNFSGASAILPETCLGASPDLGAEKSYSEAEDLLPVSESSQSSASKGTRLMGENFYPFVHTSLLWPCRMWAASLHSLVAMLTVKMGQRIP